MRLISIDERNIASVNYMFLPTFIGLNTPILKELEDKVGPLLVGKEATDDVLDEANDAILSFIEEKFPGIPGLRDYLDAVKFVEAKP